MMRLNLLLRRLLLLSALLLLLLFGLLYGPNSNPVRVSPSESKPVSRSPTAPRHLLFGVASSARSLPRRAAFLRLWCRPYAARALVFLDSPVPDSLSVSSLSIRTSSDASRFPYTFHGGLRSAVRVARIVRDLVGAVAGDDAGVRWVVLGDDDTVFFPENLAAVLRKYDHNRYYYIGGLSESVEQNIKHSFGMAFGGGGLAISYALAKVLARVIDSCLMRYGHLYGSDSRVFSCLAELGVPLTHEAGFHQVDLRGDIFGMLSAHPLAPLISLHHVDYFDPIFPGMNRSEALKHLFEAVNVDSGRILQQTICYDRSKLLTISISWGYAVQVFEGNQLLPDLLSLPLTFRSWKRGRSNSSSWYMFNTREVPKDLCKRPYVFFFETALSNKNGIESNYTRHGTRMCTQQKDSAKHLQVIRVSSKKLDPEIWQAPRRQCCDVTSSSDEVMNMDIRKCKDDELIAMNA